MEIGRVDGLVFSLPKIEESKKENSALPKDFGTMLNEALEKVNDLQLEADSAIQDVVLGKEEDLHRALIALERANLALGLTVQVRNKVIEAYQEIMRMQL